MSYDSLLAAIKFHETNKIHWCGESLTEYKHAIWDYIEENNINSILDYGCGKASYHKILFNNKKLPGCPKHKINIVGYDPAVEQFAQKPTDHFQMALCIDVMEHVQEDKVDEILQDLFNYADKVFIVITCYAATQFLEDGRNVHFTVKEPEWWKEKLKLYKDKIIKSIFQTKPNRGGKKVNKEEWSPSEKTLKKLKIEEERGITINNYLDETQREKAKLL
jgi:hypothetical protein